MSSDALIQARDISKVYLLYRNPADRLRSLVRSSLTHLFPFNRCLRSSHVIPEFWALHDVSLEIRRGETIGIVGRNGSGKSTLLQIICGTLCPTTGTVSVGGRISAILELGAGFNPEFTGRENLRLNAAIHGLSKREIENKLAAIVEFADIGLHFDQPVKTYSSGMYARLAFAIAIHVDPDILVVDEALAVGDEAFQRKCFAQLEKLKRNGVTILFVSHSGSTIVQLCDRAILLHRGQKIYDGNPKTAIFYHQKLGHAEEMHEKEVLKEISLTASGGPLPASDRPASGSKLPVASNELRQRRSTLNGAQYDPSLISQSLLSYEKRGAEIAEFTIVDDENRTVNILHKGKGYTIHCTVNAEASLQNVRFYTLIRTITGLELAGCSYPPRSTTGLDIENAGRHSFKVSFECLLNPGTYFVSFALSASDGTLHHRIIDAMPFRVCEDNIRSSTALVDLHFHVSYSQTSSKSAIEGSDEPA